MGGRGRNCGCAISPVAHCLPLGWDPSGVGSDQIGRENCYLILILYNVLPRAINACAPTWKSLTSPCRAGSCTTLMLAASFSEKISKSSSSVMCKTTPLSSTVKLILVEEHSGTTLKS